MKKTRELIEENLKLVDVVLEVCDARIPESSRNPVIEEITGAKPRVVILNKCDLADDAATKKWRIHFKKAFAVNAMSGEGVNTLLRELKGYRRLMIVGIPNSGKSSLINRLTGRRAAQVGNRPGITRGKQWLTLENGMQLLDTPGILWPKFEDPQVGLNLAFCGSIRDEIMDLQDLGLELIRCLLVRYSALLTDKYGLEGSVPAEDEDYALAVMEEIARVRGHLLPGARIDYERTARTVLDEFRSGKIGRITLESPPR